MKKQFPVLLFILLASINVSADTERVIQPYPLETLAVYLIYLWRASAKPEKLFSQVRWKLLLKPILALILLILLFIALLSLAEFLPEAWARHLSTYERLGRSLDALFRTLFFLPYATFRIESVTGNHQLGSGLLIWPLIFWFVVFILASFLNFLMVKATRMMRIRLLTEQGDNVAL